VIVPHPTGGILYLKLRDDPATVQTLTLPVIPIVLPSTETASAKGHAAQTPAGGGAAPGSGQGSSLGSGSGAAPANAPPAAPQPAKSQPDGAPVNPPATQPQ
jgi:hypothetical protein